ncbi:six-hairpin glycosidase-like protein [Flavivirga rizhaonensis]|uniref:Six-hairpin glycosidase-like protein n=1 Tax=Flavivirga rizhaonensis TaxID=2559571 RepID=A0A4S1E3K5_9FLAO|nr:six-hairpin glycosidase-like protein [Flavivirga rizhaonensis]TGV04618.1 six-hairpin glycosidase-like protein [Flavivirga rizhaonensis]
MRKTLILFVAFIMNALLFPYLLAGQNSQKNYWKITDKNEIQFDFTQKGNLPYSDNIEMAGKRVAGIVSYAVDTLGKLTLEREIFFPQLHEFKNSEDTWFHDYRAYLQGIYSDELLPKLYINNEEFVPGSLSKIAINGILNFEHKTSKNGIALTRALFPSMDERLFVEMWTVKNTTNSTLNITSGNSSLSFEDFGAKGKYSRKVISEAPDNFTLKAGEEKSFAIKIMAKMENEEFPSEKIEAVLEKRNDFLAEMKKTLQLETPNEALNTLFEFSKIRASESIFESELGLIHSPGGGRYYVGIWANDQAEYINPFFPYLEYDIGNQSAMNTFRAFAKETNPEFNKIRYSFEIEGLVKPFLKDRGDAAMIAYGAAHYAMALGDIEIANELWPLIQWCLEYCHRQLNEEGVVLSESDEMEGRIETGNANLSTSSLYYGALDLAVHLGRSLGKPKSVLKKYKDNAKNLNQSVESYFGANVEGLDTYKYYKEHKYLRHWICLPLVVGINKRKEATIEALFDRLWTDNGVHVEKNSDNEEISKIFWDRGTLYALRGTFFSGEVEQSLEKLVQFSEKRLIGNRVPYVVEAYPEGGMAHLSAESALYCRVFIEGMFGIVPTGLKSFKFTPRLPESWNFMELNNIKAFGEDFSIKVTRKRRKMGVKVIKRDGVLLFNETISTGSSIKIKFKK